VDDIPPLTEDERTTLSTLRRGQASWVPIKALRYAWMHVDPVHGGGRWSLATFHEALHADEAGERDAGLEAVGRLYRWLSELGYGSEQS
jgi:hypothetical protein